MKQWLLRLLWPDIEPQVGDIATILRGLWADGPPNNFRLFHDDLKHALKMVLYHGRPKNE
jgi:hypothetical protein